MDGIDRLWTTCQQPVKAVHGQFGLVGTCAGALTSCRAAGEIIGGVVQHFGIIGQSNHNKFDTLLYLACSRAACAREDTHCLINERAEWKAMLFYFHPLA